MNASLFQSRLFLRIYAAFVVIVGLTIGMFFLVVDPRIAGEMMSQKETGLRVRAAMLARYAAPELFAHPNDPALHARLRELGESVHEHLSILSLEGAIIADSGHDSSFAGHPYADVDVTGWREASVSRGYSEALNAQALTVALPIRENGEARGFVRVSYPLESIHAQIVRVRRSILEAMLVVALVAVLLGALIARLVLRPIRRLTRAALAIGEGDLSQRLPEVGRDEIGVLSHALNDMVTNLKGSAEAMRRAKEAALAADRAKSEFLANMSHEIRTPMNGVIGMTELALATVLTRDQREYLEAVRGSADALLGVINDVLDFSKIEAGRVELEEVDFGLRECVEETLRALAFRAHEKGLELVGDVSPEVPASVVGDPLRVRQILMNLVGNGIKFTESGEVVVRVDAVAHDDRVQLTISVRDTGIGIPAQKQATIFEAFGQADSSTTRQFGGTGLGLSISSGLVALMGGKIALESEAGHGSTFRVSLDLPIGATVKTARWRAPSARWAGLKVLIVDDNAINRRVVHGFVSSWGMLPVAVESGAVALDALRQAAKEGEPFQVVLLDVMMPKMDGFAVAERIRDDATLGKPRVVMLSSMNLADPTKRCQELGLAAYIMKPLRYDEVFDAVFAPVEHVTALGSVAPIASGAPLHAAAARPSMRSMSAKPVEAGGDGSPTLRILLAEDNPINRKVATTMLTKRGHRVTSVVNGREAVDRATIDEFDVILMDVQMPEMDGFEATARIRELQRRARRTPIVAMTAHAMAGDRERCLAAGMDDYLSKPIQGTGLAEVLARVMGASGVLPVEHAVPTSVRVSA